MGRLETEVNTYAVRITMLITDIEDDIMEPVMQCTTFPASRGFSVKRNLVSLSPELPTRTTPLTFSLRVYLILNRGNLLQPPINVVWYGNPDWPASNKLLVGGSSARMLYESNLIMFSTGKNRCSREKRSKCEDGKLIHLCLEEPSFELESLSSRRFFELLIHRLSCPYAYLRFIHLPSIPILSQAESSREPMRRYLMELEDEHELLAEEQPLPPGLVALPSESSGHVTESIRRGPEECEVRDRGWVFRLTSYGQGDDGDDDTAIQLWDVALMRLEDEEERRKHLGSGDSADYFRPRLPYPLPPRAEVRGILACVISEETILKQKESLRYLHQMQKQNKRFDYYELLGKLGFIDKTKPNAPYTQTIFNFLVHNNGKLVIDDKKETVYVNGGTMNITIPRMKLEEMKQYLFNILGKNINSLYYTVPHNEFSITIKLRNNYDMHVMFDISSARGKLEIYIDHVGVNFIIAKYIYPNATLAEMMNHVITDYKSDSEEERREVAQNDYTFDQMVEWAEQEHFEDEETKQVQRHKEL
ncbi:hypothetical protein Tco_1203026 [Tanacetum coccineum]